MKEVSTEETEEIGLKKEDAINQTMWQDEVLRIVERMR